MLCRRRFEIYFKTSSDTKSLPIRDVKSSSIGKLINIKGIITRATEVKPMMQVRSFIVQDKENFGLYKYIPPWKPRKLNNN